MAAVKKHDDGPLSALREIRRQATGLLTILMGGELAGIARQEAIDCVVRIIEVARSATRPAMKGRKES